ncbi:MAG: histidine kinase [Flavobacteriaceae bacterium]|nr:histidine kinase [Flavobacteriaceae bacterium]
MIQLKNRSISTKYHILFWLGYFSFNVVRWGSYFHDYWYSIKSNLVEFPLHILMVYLNVYYLIPKYILKKKYKRYILLLFLSLGAAYVLRSGLNYLLVTENIWPEAESSQQAFTFNHVVAVVLGELYVIAFATAIKLTIDWVQEKKRYRNLEALQLKTELEFLKTQIQPHFFFNTLNNLYALTLEKSKKAPEVVLKLSEIMEYILYEAKEPKIRLFKEIKSIQNYIDLEKLRYGDKVNVNVNIIGDIESNEVPTLLFLTFIENCFKHGARYNNHLDIEITFKKLPNSYIYFCASNSYNEFSNKVKKHGIGNANIERRLQLLFREDYTLNITTENQRYKVELTFPLYEISF